jgi:hypothetical protein
MRNKCCVYSENQNYICRLWQRPKDSFLDSDAVWYCNAPVGEKKLKTFLSSLSKATNLSKVYTNHSIRATGASILSKCMFGPSQVMSVTGHKSVQSLSVYQRVSDQEKIQMRESLGMNLLPTSSPSLLPTSTPAVCTVPADNMVSNDNTDSALYEVQNMEHDVVEQLFSDFEVQENQRSVLRPICFSNCTVNIANLNVHMK